MDLLRILKIIQLVLAAAITFFVLIQSKGTGLSSAFGGMAGQYRTKRGVEKLLFTFTIVVGILFVVNSLLIVLFS
ncbi:preprotein translocase subunit SecG [candidate division WWE3 bacterium]|jgi:protein translocase SecG subunit|nr:preprotein translocase subunit SecG [candidate division WWE3 bacterium]MBT7349420.1 preprotein translocase subunit SecG [candidate division WWE3 bacterium]